MFLLKKNIINENEEKRTIQSNKVKIYKIFELAKKSNFDNPNNFNRNIYAKK
jgi:TPP-dependent pyruvate/acetoin dehydrogenase alpha subunit